MPQQTLTHTISSTQAGGPVVANIDPTHFRPVWDHSIQVEITNTSTGTPAVAVSGTLSVRAKVPRAETFQELGTLDLTAPDLVVFSGFYVAIEAESFDFDGDKTWTLHIIDGS